MAGGDKQRNGRAREIFVEEKLHSAGSSVIRSESQVCIFHNVYGNRDADANQAGMIPGKTRNWGQPLL
jgi:hypothetical protein